MGTLETGCLAFLRHFSDEGPIQPSPWSPGPQFSHFLMATKKFWLWTGLDTGTGHSHNRRLSPLSPTARGPPPTHSFTIIRAGRFAQGPPFNAMMRALLLGVDVGLPAWRYAGVAVDNTGHGDAMPPGCCNSTTRGTLPLVPAKAGCTMTLAPSGVRFMYILSMG